MRIATVRERKDGEQRVGLTPPGVRALVADGHEVLVEPGAGIGAGFSDEAYESAGGRLVTAEAAWREAELMVKVKEPVAAELPWLRPGLVLFSFLNLPRDRALTEALLSSETTGVAYEQVVLPDGSRPLLAPMSAVSGRMAAEIAIQLLKQPGPGRGRLIGGVAGLPPGRAVVVGSGAAGAAAAEALLAFGAQVTIVARDGAKLARLRERLGGRPEVATSSPIALARLLAGADVLVLALLVPGEPAPKVVTREMVRSMGAGAVLIDICIDQGGAAETSRLTTHSDPTFVDEGVVHYCVTNMPGAVPQTSTLALTAATLPYVRAIARLGVERAPEETPGLAQGLSTHRGVLLRADAGITHNLPVGWHRAGSPG